MVLHTVRWGILPQAPAPMNGLGRFLSVIRDSTTADAQIVEHTRNHSRDFLRLLAEAQTTSVLREAVSRAAHTSLRVADAAYALANEGRRLLECDRVTVLTCQGRRFRVVAISGQDVFDRRSN